MSLQSESNLDFVKPNIGSIYNPTNPPLSHADICCITCPVCVDDSRDAMQPALRTLRALVPCAAAEDVVGGDEKF